MSADDPQNSPLDLQLNGYRGIDFNADSLSLGDLKRAADLLRADHAGQCLATIITDSIDAMSRRIGNIRRALDVDPDLRSVFVGIHVEGPFINSEPGYHGAHPRQHTRPSSLPDAQRLFDAGGEWIRLVTLAPESDPDFAATRFFANAGVLVSAGHCNPSSKQLRQAIDAGLSLFTHLGNGCPAVLPRHDNIIQRTLACRSLPFVMLIADGVHVPAEAFSNYLQLIGLHRAIAVTDGTSAAGMGPGRYQLGGREVLVDASGAAWSPDRSHLIGSTATLAEVRKFLATAIGLSDAEIDQLTITNPRRALARAHTLAHPTSPT